MPSKRPYSHREMAKILFTPLPHEKRIPIIPTWLKIEAYTLFFEVLPHLISIAIWLAIGAVFYGAVLLL